VVWWPCGWRLDGPSKFKRAVDGLPALLMSFGVGGPLPLTNGWAVRIGFL